MDKAELFDKIEAYLIGRMDKTERVEFEKQIAADEDLAIEVEFQRLEHDAMNVLVEKNLRHKMSEWQTELPSEQSSSNNSPLSIATPDKIKLGGEAKVVSLSSRFMRYAAAASVIIGVILVGLWFFNPKPQNVIVDTPAKPDTIKTTPTPANKKPTEEIVQNPNKPIDKPTEKPNNTKPIEAIPPQYNDLLAYAETNLDEYTLKIDGGNRGNNNNTKDELTQVAEAYKAQNYTQALALLQKLPVSNSVLEGLGLVNFRLKKYDKAIAYFKPLIDDTFFKDRAEWNMVLCYSAQYPAKATELKNLLNEIVKDNNHPYATKANALKEKFKL